MHHVDTCNLKKAAISTSIVSIQQPTKGTCRTNLIKNGHFCYELYIITRIIVQNSHHLQLWKVTIKCLFTLYFALTRYSQESYRVHFINCKRTCKK